MNIASNIFSIFGVLIFMLCALGLFKSKDIFVRIKLIFIANIYGFSLLLIGFLFKNPSIILSIKIILLILLNIIITILINHLIIKKISQ
ncbi:MAG: multisubunit Na+/H+ antiporter MnhG subunit [Myxococcota bacterium]|jgi:multisubunit Na+/H+ antiporter MnhG subunit